MSESDTPADLGALTEEILAAFREGRPPVLRGEHGTRFAAALDLVFARGQLGAAEHAARHLRQAFPRSRYVENLCALFDGMPPAGDQPPFDDDPARDVQVVQRTGAETAVFLFCGHSQRLGLPLAAIHRWIGRAPASLVYLRDFGNLFYLSGIRSLGPGQDAAVAALRGIAESVGARRVACYGNSGGAFAALLYGLALGAEAVLSLSGVTNLSRDFNAHLRPAVNIERVWKELPSDPVDLRQLYARAPRPPRARLVYAEHNWDDRLQAENLSGLPGVSMRTVPGDGHNAVMELIRRQEFDSELAWLVQ